MVARLRSPNRQNRKWGRVCKFEFNVDAGELRFQAAQILTEESLEESVIDRLLGTTMSMLDM